MDAPVFLVDALHSRLEAARTVDDIIIKNQPAIRSTFLYDRYIKTAVYVT